MCSCSQNAKQVARSPFLVDTAMFDTSDSTHLGCTSAEGTQSFRVFTPDSNDNRFNNGVVMIGFKGKLYCQWQSSRTDEDAPDTHVVYSIGLNDSTWTSPRQLSPTFINGFCTSGGWWATADTLVAYINVWRLNQSVYTAYTTSADGTHWSILRPVLMANGDTLNGIFEQDPHPLPDGRIINAAHFTPGIRVNPIYTDDAMGIRGWRKANYTLLPSTGEKSREMEPSWFLRGSDSLVMTFRDQQSSFRRLASVSTDRGESWTTPELTSMPDSRSKQSAGNLPNGTAFMVGNPVNYKLRVPLVVTLGATGANFNTAYLLRSGGEDLQPLRYPGKAKRPGYHYPKSMIWQGALYVAYATNKEDVEYTRVPLESLKVKN
ncbi:exo-alpha-sialidase [uncultured Draconibacterium sp.]|uniref:exo-alpha-sialidase n=1 Tax=uncultured Draconibacterium sp. TaxID=1573823 RepID=UPI0025D96FC9|nr:exo-alpha-sialidase [uncultured Draconibacterium sp.]